MAKNGYKWPNFLVQALKTPYFLITNVIGPIQGQKRGNTIPPPPNPPNKSLCRETRETRETRERQERDKRETRERLERSLRETRERQ